MPKKSEQKRPNRITLNKVFSVVTNIQRNLISQQEFRSQGKEFKSLRQEFTLQRQEFGSLRQEFRSQGTEFKSLRQEFRALDQKVDRMSTKMFSMIVDIRETMVTRQEFKEKVSMLYNHIDGFVKLHQTLDTEVAALRHGHDLLNKRVTRVEKHVGLEVGA